MLLGTDALRNALQTGLIVCDPPPERIESAHIDVHLGHTAWVFHVPWWWRLKAAILGLAISLRDADPRAWFKPVSAIPVLAIPPRGFVLAHTRERIGSVPGSGIVPMLHTRSTLARWGLSVCTANAGQGDEGYTSYWTLELVNPHPCWIALPYAARVGAISFHRLDGAAVSYDPGTRYNPRPTEWTPAALLPKIGNWYHEGVSHHVPDPQ